MKRASNPLSLPGLLILASLVFAGLILVSVQGDGAVTRSQPADALSPRPPLSPVADEPSPQRMAEAARQFLTALSPEQRAAAEFPLDADAERTRWSNLPASMVERGGVRVGDLSDMQRRRLHDLLRASTSSQGYQKIAGVIRLDEVLHEEAAAASASGERRVPAQLLDSWTSANYWASFFGQPGEPAWGWLIHAWSVITYY